MTAQSRTPWSDQMRKEKFDLSNVGGQPKDWAQKDCEAEVDFSGWDSLKVVLTPIVCVVAIVGGIGYFLFRAAKYFG